jgi:hypothetical protein
VPTIGDLTTWPVGSAARRGRRRGRCGAGDGRCGVLLHALLRHHHHLILRDCGGLDDADLAFAFGHFEFSDVRFGDEVDQCLEFS